MRLSVIAVALLGNVVVAWPWGNKGGERCCDVPCYKALETGAHKGYNAKGDCKSYQHATITPCEATVTKTVHGHIPTVTATVTEGCSSSHKEPSKPRSEALPLPNARSDQPISPNSGAILDARNQVCPATHKPSHIPSYATKACSPWQYASACSCLGFPAKTTTLPRCTTTRTKTAHPSTMTTTVTVKPCTSTSTVSTTITVTSVTSATVATSTDTVTIGDTESATTTETTVVSVPTSVTLLTTITTVTGIPLTTFTTITDSTEETSVMTSVVSVTTMITQTSAVPISLLPRNQPRGCSCRIVTTTKTFTMTAYCTDSLTATLTTDTTSPTSTAYSTATDTIISTYTVGLTETDTLTQTPTVTDTITTVSTSIDAMSTTITEIVTQTSVVPASPTFALVLTDQTSPDNTNAYAIFGHPGFFSSEADDIQQITFVETTTSLALFTISPIDGTLLAANGPTSGDPVRYNVDYESFVAATDSSGADSFGTPDILTCSVSVTQQLNCKFGNGPGYFYTCGNFLGIYKENDGDPGCAYGAGHVVTLYAEIA